MIEVNYSLTSQKHISLQFSTDDLDADRMFVD